MEYLEETEASLELQKRTELRQVVGGNHPRTNLGKGANEVERDETGEGKE